MKQHKFTVIVTTRERANTLYWCLKTLVAQDYENLEILVSDNFSQDNTKEVVDSFTDKRIRYINTGRRVEMTVNYEFALSHVTEGYVHYLGDDDGMLLGGITNVNIIANMTNQQILSCAKANYTWDGAGEYANMGYLSLLKTVSIAQTKTMLEKYQRYEIEDFFGLLSIYHQCFVDIQLINKIKQQTSGKFFRACAPDVYSSLILPRYVDSYANSNLCVSIVGTSPRSNGANLHTRNLKGELGTFYKEMQDFPLDEELKSIFLNTMTELDALLQIEPKENRHILIKWALPKLLSENQHKQEIYSKENLIYIEQLAKNNNLGDYFTTLLPKYSPNKYREQNNETILANCGLFTDYDTLTVNCREMGITNIYEFSKCVSTLLNFKSNYKPILIKNPQLNALFTRLGRGIEKIPFKLWDKA
jgi:glycosyltransferase involved in cell wall biosynthesis